MSDFIKRKVALHKAMEKILKKLKEKGENCQELEAAFSVITKELISVHIKDEVLDALEVIFKTTVKNL